MPHLFNNILAVRYAELVPEFYSSVASLSTVVRRSEVRGYGMKRIIRGCYTKDALIEFDSLPQRIQEALGDPRKTGHVLEQFYNTDNKAIEYFTSYQFKDMTYIADTIQQKYITNASVLQAVALLKSAREHERITKGFSAKGIFNSLTADVASFNLVLKKQFGIEHSLPSTPTRFKPVFDKFFREGYSSLISKKHKNQNSKKVTDTVVILLNNLFAGTKHKPTATDIARQYESFLSGYLEVISQETGEIFSTTGYPKLSKGTVTSYLNQWSNKIGTYAKRSGNRQVLMQKFSPYHSLEKPKFAGEIISIDDRQPPFKYSGNKRAWFYMGIDLGSEAWTVWVHGTTKEGLIIDFYRQLVKNYYEWGFNLPAELEAESSLNSSFKNTFLQEGRMFQTVRIEANKARAKKVERYFGKLRYEYEKQREGWVARPFAGSESNQLGSADVPTIPYNQIIDNSLNDIEEWNNSPHSEHKDKTRWEVFCEKQHPELKPTNYRAILPYLGYKTATSCNAGIIKLQGREWLLGDKGEIYSGENLIALMKNVEGRKVDIYWLDKNDGDVMKALVYINDQYMCEALAKPTYSRSKIGRSADDAEKRTIMSKYALTIDGYMRDQKNIIEKVMVIDETPKTLNNNFSIKRKDATQSPELTIIEQDVEQLEQLEDEFDMAEYSGIKSSQLDRF